ncbi:periodic tryptophan protein 1 homolog [Photinus pyralis]|uniref:periodic tryptophan protein 1 homolog n=1 Tax=Photinus pyralis TaxID=7054 RepID=UPI001266E919|nr:periodic tryptophan protein 1 homolog [Photinus pyralis]
MEEEPKPGRINFISCVKWVKKGVAKGLPEKVRLNKQELVRLINQTKADLQASEAANNEEGARMNMDDEFDLENYDQGNSK